MEIKQQDRVANQAYGKREARHDCQQNAVKQVTKTTESETTFNKKLKDRTHLETREQSWKETNEDEVGTNE